MARYPTTPEVILPTRKSNTSLASIPDPKASARLKSAAAVVMGTLIRKENRAASSRRRPRKRPIVIVAPERETPGNRAAVWASPIPSASLKPSLSEVRVCRPTTSPTMKSAPTSTRLNATSHGERTSSSKKFWNKSPTTPAPPQKGPPEIPPPPGQYHPPGVVFPGGGPAAGNPTGQVYGSFRENS